MVSPSLAEHWSRVPDPRHGGDKRHSLSAMLNLVTVAVLSGMRRLQGIAQFGRSLSNEHKAALDLLRQVLLPDRMVTADAMFTHRDFGATVLQGGGD